ncbi:coilin-like [Salvia splendens]|uniref:coilin-like n=1 Tax=Salvia splendens TaxID=180675 RepID=UPI001C26F0C4|nr:coilin-like [Salvia splendens]
MGDVMEVGKRIRVVFKDDDILSDIQKLEGLSRSWVLLDPHRHGAVSDLASHLLHAFRLHQSCPHGLILSISGFALPPFVSTRILKDDEIISVRRRKDILSIEGSNAAANDVQKLKTLEKRPVDAGALLLANGEFEKEKGGYESDESEDDDEDLLDVVEDSAAENPRKKNRKRKAAERLEGNKEKKQRSVVTGNASGDVCKEKKDASVARDNVENKDNPAKHSDEDNVVEPGEERIIVVQEKDNKTDDAEILPKETKKVPSRSARRAYKKRIWLREMAKIQKQNATCESEGLRNWKEDQAKADRKKWNGQSNRQQKWKKYQAEGERNKDDGQPKGLLHWKLFSQDNRVVKGKKHKRHSQNDDCLELPKQNGDVRKQKNQNGDVQHEQQNQNYDKHEQLTQMSDTLEQPSHGMHEQPDQSSPSVQECINQNCDASKQSNYNCMEENEFAPIEIRPGHIRFEPLEEEEAVQRDHAPLKTFNWNGITSKKNGQQWGKESRRFTPRNDYGTSKEDSEALTKEKKKQPNERISFDKLPPLPGAPKKGDLIAYRVLELSSTWTPELSAHRVGKVSWYNAESQQMMLLPVPEYPLVYEEDDEGEATELDNSLYREDGSLEIDFSALIDVRVLTNGGSTPGNKVVTRVNEVSTSNMNALKTALPGSSGEPTSEPSPDTRESDHGKETQQPSGEISGSVWDQLSEALYAKKEQLFKENGWGSNPKKVVISSDNSWGKNANKMQPSPGSNWGKKPQPSQDKSWGKQNVGSKSWSYKAERQRTWSNNGYAEVKAGYMKDRN